MFSSEIYDYCQNLSEDGSDLYHGVKSNILNRSEQVTNRIEISHQVLYWLNLVQYLEVTLIPVLLKNLLNDCSIMSKNCLLATQVLISFVASISTIVWKIWLETHKVMVLSCYLMMTHHYLVSLMIPFWRTLTVKNDWIYIELKNLNLIRKIIQLFIASK